MGFITYGNEEMEIVKNGAAAVESVLSGADMEKKERLLFCLDRFMDPWFGYDLPCLPEIELILQNVIISANTISVKESALQLLCDYCWPPFPILEDNLEQIEEELLPDVRYVIERD